MPSFASRLLHAVLAAAVATGLLLLFFWYRGDGQDALSDATQRLAQGSMDRLQPYIDDVWGQLLTAGLAAMLAPLGLAIVWLFAVERDPPAGDGMAASKRNLWIGLLFAVWVAVGAVSWFALLHNPIAEFMAPGLDIKALLVTEAAATIGYYFATALGVSRSSLVSVPGASAWRRR